MFNNLDNSQLFEEIEKARKSLEDNQNFSYCKVCGSCGESGCCSPSNCREVRCLYQKTKLKDLLSYVKEMADLAYLQDRAANPNDTGINLNTLAFRHIHDEIKEILEEEGK